jgi:hypothetical protein
MHDICLPKPKDSQKEYEVNVYKIGSIDPLLSTQSQVVEIIKKDCYTHLFIQFSDALGELHSIGYEKVDHVSFLTNQVDIYLI